jgi:hypothetical protein
MRAYRAIAVLGLLLAAWPAGARAGDRHFTYNYESGVLDQGEKEIETYTTYRFGRDGFYSAIDQNLEFETGLGGGVQTSLYLNFTQAFTADGLDTSGPVLDGISNEWKFKLADSVADPLGIGLYLEPEFEPDEFELEMKLILDKKSGPWLWTLNLLGAPAFGYVDNSSAFLFRPSAGLGCFLSDALFLGAEVMDENFYDDRPMRSVLSGGPTLEYSGKGWWAALTFMPQWASVGSPVLDFNDSQRDQIRVATSFSL